MRRNSLAQHSILVIAALITATGLTASGASAEATGTVTGVLTTPGGAPVANADVFLDGPPPFQSVATRSDGTYTITGVTPGSYRVRFTPQGRPSQYAFGKTNYSEAAMITVAADATTTVNETLLPVGYITGRLVNADGVGVASAQVSGVPTSSSGVFAYAFTAADGTYSVAVFPGSYRVEFRLSSGFLQYAYGTTSWSAAAIITVPGADQTVTVNDTLLATGSMAGRLVNSAGAAMVNTELTLSGNTYYYARTDASGNYRFPQVVPGEYRVSVRNSLGMSMYAPQTQNWNQAQLYPITAGNETALDLTFLPTGMVNGRFTSGGVGVAGVRVNIGSDFNFASTTTNSNGEYQFPEALGGSYRVRFEKPEAQPQIAQFAQGKVTYDSANLFTLVPGSTLTVNDTQLAAGSLRLTARDSLTRAQIQDFSISLDPFWGSTENGVITMNDLPQGTYKAWINGPGYAGQERQIVINGGRQTSLEIELVPEGRVSVTVVDRATGAPVEGICVFLVYKYHPTVPDGCDGSDENGRMTLYAPTGDYTMMALPAETGYGVQWVGPNGGTGDQRQAAVISVVNGQSVTAPTIRLDRPGSISGTVTSETGEPIGFGEVALLTVNSAVGNSGWGTAINSDGSYRLEGLGPYQWPLFLWGVDHAYQWSGGKANRLEAQKIQVTSGGTATYNHVLKVGTTVLKGTLKDDDGDRIYGWLGAFDPVTNDYAGQAWISDTEPFELRVLAPQQVRILADGYWYGGTSPQTADLLMLRAGTSTLNLCVVGSVTVVACGRLVPVRPVPPTPPGGTLPPQRPLPGIPPTNPVPAPPGALPPIRR